MTSVKSKLKTSVQAAKSQIGTKAAADEAHAPKTKPKTAQRKPKSPAPQSTHKGEAQPQPKPGHRLAVVLEPTGAPAASAGDLFPSRVWPD
jgi:hypothetical protein